MTAPLISTTWLAENLNTEDLFILDASVDKVIGKEPITYEKPITLPNSYKICIETELCDTESTAIHAFPNASQVQAVAEKIGFNPNSTLVIYDNQGIYSAPRAWWIFICFGFRNVFILDGGLPKWLDEQRPTQNTYLQPPSKPETLNKNLTLTPSLLTSANDILENIETKKYLVVDVRSEARFSGTVEEPRPGVRRGHIPNAINLPFSRVLENTQYKTPEQLTDLFATALENSKAPLIFSCGSGVTACIVLVAAKLAGVNQVSLYDGSWAEWGSDNKYPIAV